MTTTIKNPIEYTGAQIANIAHALGSLGHSVHHIQDTIHSPAPAVRKIAVADLKDALAMGFEDFKAYRTDLVFLCAIYAVVGLVLARLAFGMDMLPLVFPLASGFALIGPLAAIGLYEMSRMRERGEKASWMNVLEIGRAPAAGGILMLGLLLVAIFLAWQATAWAIYRYTLGPAEPVSVASFFHNVFFTVRGWELIVIGVGAGFLFALVAMSISLVSFPLLLDRDVGLDTAIATSIRAVRANPVPAALWGLIVAVGLVAGSIPLFVGLVITVPVLGHATWHLYRKIVT
jgi:uncharacterized membrane protein